MKLDVVVLNKEMIKVVKAENYTFKGKRFKGWALYIEGLGFMSESQDRPYPYMVDTKKYAQGIKDGWGFDWDFGIVKAD